MNMDKKKTITQLLSEPKVILQRTNTKSNNKSCVKRKKCIRRIYDSESEEEKEGKGERKKKKNNKNVNMISEYNYNNDNGDNNSKSSSSTSYHRNFKLKITKTSDKKKDRVKLFNYLFGSTLDDIDIIDDNNVIVPTIKNKFKRKSNDNNETITKTKNDLELKLLEANEECLLSPHYLTCNTLIIPKIKMQICITDHFNFDYNTANIVNVPDVKCDSEIIKLNDIKKEIQQLCNEPTTITFIDLTLDDDLNLKQQQQQQIIDLTNDDEGNEGIFDLKQKLIKMESELLQPLVLELEQQHLLLKKQQEKILKQQELETQRQQELERQKQRHQELERQKQQEIERQKQQRLESQRQDLEREKQQELEKQKQFNEKMKMKQEAFSKKRKLEQMKIEENLKKAKVKEVVRKNKLEEMKEQNKKSEDFQVKLTDTKKQEQQQLKSMPDLEPITSNNVSRITTAPINNLEKMAHRLQTGQQQQQQVVALHHEEQQFELLSNMQFVTKILPHIKHYYTFLVCYSNFITNLKSMARNSEMFLNDVTRMENGFKNAKMIEFSLEFFNLIYNIEVESFNLTIILNYIDSWFKQHFNTIFSKFSICQIFEFNISIHEILYTTPFMKKFANSVKQTKQALLERSKNSSFTLDQYKILKNQIIRFHELRKLLENAQKLQQNTLPPRYSPISPHNPQQQHSVKNNNNKGIQCHSNVLLTQRIPVGKQQQQQVNIDNGKKVISKSNENDVTLKHLLNSNSSLPNKQNVIILQSQCLLAKSKSTNQTTNIQNLTALNNANMPQIGVSSNRNVLTMNGQNVTALNTCLNIQNISVSNNQNNLASSKQNVLIPTSQNVVVTSNRRLPAPNEIVVNNSNNQQLAMSHNQKLLSSNVQNVTRPNIQNLLSSVNSNTQNVLSPNLTVANTQQLTPNNQNKSISNNQQLLNVNNVNLPSNSQTTQNTTQQSIDNYKNNKKINIKSTLVLEGCPIIDKIDLTWIDDVDPVELKEEIDSFPIKEELDLSQKKNNETNNNQQENINNNQREVISPADSGLGSPIVPNGPESPVVPNGKAFQCSCGEDAIFVCRCNSSTYCSRDCQYSDWPNHQRLCHRIFEQESNDDES